MSVPRLRPAKKFLDAILCPCQVAKVRLSALGTVGSSHRKKYKEDRYCRISLRVSSDESNFWSRDMLEFLFSRGGLALAIQEGMREYESGAGFPGYDKLDVRTYREIVDYGIVPFITISELVLDEAMHTALILGSTEWDGNLNEHGICIYLEEGRWRFGYAERLSEYISSVQKGMGTVLPSKPSATRGPRQAGVAPSFLYGSWGFDKKEARKVMREKRLAPSYLNAYLRLGEGVSYVFSPTSLRIISNYPFSAVDDYTVLRYEAVGDLVRITYCKSDEKEARVRCFRKWENVLMDEEEQWIVLRKNEG